MPKLRWDATDFLDCLEVFPEEPDEGEYGEWYSYVVEKQGLNLLLTVRPYESVVSLSLYEVGSQTPFTSFTLFVRGPVQYIKDKRGTYLEFCDCIIGLDSLTYLYYNNVFDQTQFKLGLTVRLSIKPRIRILYAESESF